MPQKDNVNTVYTKFKIPKNYYQILKEYADAKDVSVVSLWRNLLIDWVKREKEEIFGTILDHRKRVAASIPPEAPVDNQDAA